MMADAMTKSVTATRANTPGATRLQWGIVTVVTNTGGADAPNVRGDKLVAAIQELKTKNTDSSSPLNGKLAGRYGTSGYSMGGGGTTFASEKDPTMLTSVGLADLYVRLCSMGIWTDFRIL